MEKDEKPTTDEDFGQKLTKDKSFFASTLNIFK